VALGDPPLALMRRAGAPGILEATVENLEGNGEYRVSQSFSDLLTLLELLEPPLRLNNPVAVQERCGASSAMSPTACR
jgi:hypothetical protein